jgi:hypothetical protein
MRLEIGKFLPMRLSGLPPVDQTRVAADVVKMLQGAGKLLIQSGASDEAIASFTADALDANRIARETVANEGFDPNLAYQVELPLKSSI